MEAVLSNGFCELSINEAKECNGGDLTVAIAAAAVTAVGTALSVSYKAGVAVGKFIRNVVG